MATLSQLFLRSLRCPYCGDRFAYTHAGVDRLGNTYGHLTSGCGEFPVIAGIPIIRLGTIGNQGESVSDVVAAIKGGDLERALLSMIIPVPRRKVYPATDHWHRGLRNKVLRLAQRATRARWRRQAIIRATQRFRSISNNPSVEEMLHFYLMENGHDRRSLYEFFLYRYGLPRHVTTIGMLQIIRDPPAPVVDIGCGFGHMTREILRYVDSPLVIGVDRAFFGLYVAKTLMAPQAEYVCYDANDHLPFTDGVFRSAITVDGIHYIDQKCGLLQELARITVAGGVLMLISSRNANVEFAKAGIPLTPEGYSTLLAHLPHRILADRNVVLSYLEKEGPDLTGQESLDNLHDEPLLSIVATQDLEKFRAYAMPDRHPFLSRRLSVNPLYRPVAMLNENEVILRRHFPPNYNAHDSVDCGMYLPEQVAIDRAHLGGLRADEDYGCWSELIDRFLYLDLPERYCVDQHYDSKDAV
jgi:SAM-dependent methyltransferase